MTTQSLSQPSTATTVKLTPGAGQQPGSYQASLRLSFSESGSERGEDQKPPIGMVVKMGDIGRVLSKVNRELEDVPAEPMVNLYDNDKINKSISCFPGTLGF